MRNTRLPRALTMALALVLAAAVSAQAEVTVISTSPANGATNVDPKTDRLRIAFSEEVSNTGWSFVTTDLGEPVDVTGKPVFIQDNTVCLAPISLYPGITYVVSINSEKFVGFRSERGKEAVKPYLLKFTTAGTKPTGKAAEVKVVGTFPANGAKNVDVLTPAIKIRFTGPVCSNGYSFVTTDLGKEVPSEGSPVFSEGNTVCELPVRLEPGTTYSFSVNSDNYHGFRNAKNPDVAVTPYLVTFSTGAGADAKLLYRGDVPGSWGAFDSDLRFEYVGPGRVVMYQLPAAGKFRVFGKVRVVATGQTCKNGWIGADGKVLSSE